MGPIYNFFIGMLLPVPKISLQAQIYHQIYENVNALTTLHIFLNQNHSKSMGLCSLHAICILPPPLFSS